jgi:DNA ligase (NAD+)
MKLLAPTNCPSCNHILSFSSTGIDLYCPNAANCPAQIILGMSYFSGRGLGNIVGLSEKIIQKLNEEFGIKDIADLYSLDYERIEKLEGLGEKSANNIKKSVQESKEKLVDYKLLAGFGIDGVGPEVAKLILKRGYTIS